MHRSDSIGSVRTKSGFVESPILQGDSLSASLKLRGFIEGFCVRFC